MVGSLSFPFNTKKQPYNVILDRGRYKFELWGGSGGDSKTVPGGRGAYVSGVMYVYSPLHVLVYVGGQGEEGIASEFRPQGGFNGGGNGGLSFSNSTIKYSNGGGGGGSSDVRLNESKETRILVAAGGGGAGGLTSSSTSNPYQYGGYGGDEEGGMGGGLEKTLDLRKKVANQTFGYDLLQGQEGRSSQEYHDDGAEGNGGGGGGYWGGISPEMYGFETRAGGNGGSSFVNTTFFPSYKLMSGAKSFLSPDGEQESGHTGDGFCRITFIPLVTCECKKRFHYLTLFTYIIIPFS